MSKRVHSDLVSSGNLDLSVVPGTASMDTATNPGHHAKRFLSSASDQVSFTRVRSLEELDKRALQLQNKKLWEALTERKAAIGELRERIEQLENRQAKDDALLCVINRYWNQLDEDCLILLQRFDSDAEEEISASTESFLKQLASWDKEEVPDKLQERVHFSKRIIARLLSAYEKMVTRNSRLRHIFPPVSDQGSNSKSDANFPFQQHSDSHETDLSEPRSLSDRPPVADQLMDLKHEITQLNRENQRLQSLCGGLHAKHRQSSLRLRELQDLAQTRSDAAAEWQAKYEDLDYKLTQSVNQVTRLDHRLYDAQQRNKQLEVELASMKGTDSPGVDESGSGIPVNRSKYNDLTCELEELRELAANRLSELERLQRQLEERTGECASLKMQMVETPEALILNSVQYTSLKTQFNIVYNVAVQLRSQLEEARSALETNRHNHLKHIEEMEANETAILNQMRSELLVIENQYSQLRRTHETMELDFKQAIAHNEQAAPINGEMRSLIATLQTQNKQLKNELVRYRRKCKEVNQDMEMVRSEFKSTGDELSQVRAALSDATAAVIAAGERFDEEKLSTSTHCYKPELSLSGSIHNTLEESVQQSQAHVSQASSEHQATSDSDVPVVDCKPSCQKVDLVNIKQEAGSNVYSRPGGRTPTASMSSIPPKTILKVDPVSGPNCPGQGSSDDTVRDLKEQLRRSQEEQKEMSVLLNMYKVIPKDQRDKAALLQCEAKLRSELSDSKAEVERLNNCISELQHTVSRLQQTRRSSTTSPGIIKASPDVRTPPVPPIASGGVATVTACSPNFQKASTVSPDEKTITTRSPQPPQLVGSNSNDSSTKSQHTSFNYQIAQLQLELQLSQRRCQTLEERLEVCQHRLSLAKQQEDVLLKEMEVTGEAFEDVQEQNVQLVKTQREKDETNLKLMTERLKSAQLARLLKEDKKGLEEQIRLMQAQIEASNRNVSKLEEKERLLLTNLNTLEKEASARQQAQEAYKRKSLESQQTSEDLRVTVQKYQNQLKDAQVSVQEKASAFERVSFRHQRLQEELVTLRRRYERLRKIEQSHNADEVLLAEVQDYKEQLTCPTCKTNRKDAILTKCFHVFCLNCLKTRYETRNRKCPKCNATFGANDYHRIYLS